ncbi:hypothetical protein SAMN04487917_102480 [Arthrobacter sp. yr096]|uniref:hypothetical protein n=1 Tax=unclassified Arthrobacter TaxID=235627 RepID=UPI0008984462|nr:MULTISPECIES: hypothetical protein [unclassified Arthrobacter]SDW01249.1 hypothetical protein SAMN04487912_101115 [Arthrobacter sp. cf158]SEI80378.1 hypothetical protein SAMN04487917_102480 [Arthrobacter sp. yr096]
MSLAHLSAARGVGPLFVSRAVLVVASLTVWAMSLAINTASLDGSRLDNVRFGALAFDLLGFAMASIASDPKTPRRQLPYLRLIWLASSIASGTMTAQSVTLTSGYLSLALNVLLGTALVFLVSMRWDLLGFLLLVAANSVLSGAYYATTPRFGSGEGLLIFFITLLPGLLGGLWVFILHSHVNGTMERRTLEALNTLTEQAHTRDSRRAEGLAETHQQIQELFAKVASSQGVPLDPDLSEQAQALAGQLRSQLMLSQSTNWLTESLALAGLESTVLVVAEADLVDRIPHASRSAALAATMLLAAPVSNTGNAMDHRPRRIHIFVEPDVEPTVLVTWRVTNLNPNRCTPALWNELESLGTPRVHTDPGGASIMVPVKAPKTW